jgi:hypothetical protein
VAVSVFGRAYPPPTPDAGLPAHDDQTTRPLVMLPPPMPQPSSFSVKVEKAVAELSSRKVCCAVLCCVVLCCAGLCCAVVCRAVPCYAMVF